MHARARTRARLHNSRSIISHVQGSIDYIVHIAVRNTEVIKPAKHMMAARSLQRIADFILQLEQGDLFVEIDHTDMVGDELAEAIFEQNPNRGARDVNAEARSSRRRFGLQTQDFISGGVAKTYNRADPMFFALMTATKIVLITHDEWNNPFTDSIADELRLENPNGMITK